mgnify:FL=1
MIDIDTASLTEIKSILQANLARNIKIYAFGSRAKGTARKHSDLDLLLKAESPIPLQTLYSLQEDFEESDIPYRIDISDWNKISDEFKQCIESEKLEIDWF